MKIAVVGSNGQLGSDVCGEFEKQSHEVHRLTHSDLEISSVDRVLLALRELHPDVLVNTAAFHNVEKCEADAETAFSINAVGARNLAIACAETGTAIVHVSTDYVFDGSLRRPYKESDLPCPLNVYGTSKLAGEFFVRTTCPRHFVVRTSAIYGKNPCRAKGGLNFIELMVKLSRERDQLKVVDDEIVSPTSTAELARQISALVSTDAYGVYHATAEGSCSWFEFASEIFALTGTQTRLCVAGPGDFPAKVPRPKYSVLENENLKRLQLNRFRHWREGLQEYLGARISLPYVDKA